MSLSRPAPDHPSHPGSISSQGISSSFAGTFVSAASAGPGDFTATIDWGDQSSSAGTISQPGGPGTAFVVSGGHAFLVPGTDSVSVTVTDANHLMAVATFYVTVSPSLFVLNPTAAGALTLSGNASIKIPGAVVVDSNSTTAISASGNAQLTASVIDVGGGFQKSGNASFSPAPIRGVSASDPLAALPTPASRSDQLRHLNLSGNSQTTTINPGIYSQITVSGNARLTLNPGIYIIEGGGLTVTGNASISGTGVMIYNAGSNYPGSGGNFGGITLSGNGTFNLTAPTTGTYAGILIFQSRQNTRALSFSAAPWPG